MGKYFRSYRRKWGRRFARRRVAGKRRAAKPSRAFVKKVQKIIHKDAETKQAYHSTGDNYTFFNSGINSSGDCMQVIPYISNGTGDNARVGDEIRAMKLNIRGNLQLSINVTENDSTEKRIAVRMMVVQPKRFPGYTDSVANASNWLPALLKKGGSQTAFTGVLSDLYAPINTDEITKYYDRVFYLSQSYIKSWVQSTNVGSQLASDIRKTIKFFNINIPMRNKKLRYDATYASNVVPTNFGPQLLLGYVHLDGSSPDTVTTQLGLAYDSMLSYEDI